MSNVKNIITVKVEGFPSSEKSQISNIIINAIKEANNNLKLNNFDAITIFSENTKTAMTNFINVKGSFNSAHCCMNQYGPMTEEHFKFLLNRAGG